MLTAIRQWVIKTMMKNNTGVVQTLPKKEIIELNTQITAQRLMQNGIDPEALKNANQVENAVNAIENRPKVQGGIGSTKSAKIMDMKGKEINPRSKIMGGQQSETEAEIAARMGKKNKESAERLREKSIAKFEKDQDLKEIEEAIDNASPGFAGDRKYDAQLVADSLAEKRFGKEFYDLDEIDQMQLYDEAYQGLSKQRFKQQQDLEKKFNKDVEEAGGLEEFLNKNPIDDDSGDFAQGGRAGFSDGTPDQLTSRQIKRQEAENLAAKVKEFVDVQASGSKSGKQQIQGAPEGITADSESINAIIKADIPIFQKIDLLAKYKYGKGRTRIERDGQEIDMDEGGAKSRDIGFGFNKDGEGIGGTLMYNLETGRPQFKIGIKKTFATGGRIGLKNGLEALSLGDRGFSIKPKKRTIIIDGVEYEIPIDKGFEIKPDPNSKGVPPVKMPTYPKEKRADGGRAGFFMGSQFPKGAATLRQLLNFMGKKSDVVKNPSDILRISNPKAFNKMLEDAKGKIIPKEGIMATDRIKDYQTQMAKDRVDTVKDMLERGKRFKAADDKIVGYKNEVKERFMKDFNMSEADAEKAADRMATFAMDMTKMEKTPELTKEGLLQLENILKNMETGGKKSRDLNADGGRIGFKDGMTRRTFLKILGGAMSIPIVGKILKPLKLATGVKKVPIIKTDNVAGKPEWFDALVNKVIIEGDDVTKKFATAERQSIHQKTLDDGSVVRVTEDVDDGAIRVEYESDANVYGDPVQMQYKKPLPDEGAPKPAAEFDVAESGPVGRSRGPDDYEIELDEISGTNIRDLSSDVSKLKEYATGKKPTMKEFIQNKKRRDKAKDISEGGESEMDEVIKRQGEFIQFEDIDPNMASGGIARMLGE